MARDVDHFITDILGEVAFLRTNMRGVDLEAYSGNPVLRRAVERSIQIISEAARKLPADATAKHPDIPWKEIRGIGNPVRHEYHRLSNEIIWNTVAKDIPKLGTAVRKIRAARAGKPAPKRIVRKKKPSPAIKA